MSDVIDRFQEAGQETAVVVEDGRRVGIVTSTDAFEAIARQIEDPLDGRPGRLPAGAGPARPERCPRQGGSAPGASGA